MGAKTRQDNSTAFSDPTEADQTISVEEGTSVDTSGRVGRGSVAAATFYGRPKPKRSGSAGSVGKSASISRIESGSGVAVPSRVARGSIDTRRQATQPRSN